MNEHPPVVLVVDDDPDARLIMRAALRRAGYGVVDAAGGEEGLRCYRENACDLVMLDVDMPGIDGHQLCRMLRAEAGPLLPIVMVTGMDDVASVEAAYNAGATDFIAKPVNWGLIGHRVRYLLRGHRTLLDLQAAEARNAALLEAIPDLLFEIDLEGRYIDYRAPRTELLAAPPSAFLGRTVADVLPAEAANVCMAAIREAHAMGRSSGAQFQLALPGRTAWFELSISRKAVAAGEVPRFIALSRDVTERKLAETHIASLAYFDSLTGLPNRRSFHQVVDREIARARHSGGQLAVLYMDLDGFKNINDTMGHAAGDDLLRQVGDRLRDGLRPTDMVSRPMDIGADEDLHAAATGQVARLGGDEFTALLRDIVHPRDAMAVAHRIADLLRQPFQLGERAVNLSTSIGIAYFPQDGDDAATLLKHADTAMYHAKRSGRDNARAYSQELTQQIVSRMNLEAGLRVALEQGEFHLVYQPQVDTSTGRVRAVEALLRWNHPERGSIPPAEFLPVAEEAGLIDSIGAWVLREACHAAARWRASGLPAVTLAVNLSPRQCDSADLLSQVHAALSDSGLPASALELEITEGALIDLSASTRSRLEALRALGLSLSLDDFGTGYASLAYLTRMPISRIKIDRPFVAGLLDGGESEAIVRAVLALSRSLTLGVTAEGVETLAQARALGALHCESQQGFYYSRPVRSDEVPALLTRLWSPPTAPATFTAG